MTHPFAKARNAGHRMASKYKRGGAVLDAGAAVGEGRLEKAHAAKADQNEEQDLQATGKPAKGRLDKRARGGGGFMKPPKTKGFRNPKPKMGHHLSVIIAPNMGAAPDAPPDAEPMVPKGPMGPPPGGLMGGGEPGLPGGGNTKLPGMAKRGGKARMRTDK